MEAKLVEIAMRIRELREILEITPEQAAQVTNTSIEEYLSCENGQKDFFFHLFVSMRQAVWRRHGRTGDR